MERRHRPTHPLSHRCPDCGDSCRCTDEEACSHECEPAGSVCPDCLDPACDGWCADALANEYGVEIDDLHR